MKVHNYNFGDELIDKIVGKVVEAVRTSTPSSRSRQERIEELKHNPLDLNSASESELATVPGIAQTLASRIVEAREKKGGFTNIEELTETKGISSNTINSNQWRECFVVSRSSN